MYPFAPSVPEPDVSSRRPGSNPISINAFIHDDVKSSAPYFQSNFRCILLMPAVSEAAVSCFHICYHLLAHDICKSPCRLLVKAVSLGSDLPGLFDEAVSFVQILLRNNGVAVTLVVMVAIFAEGASAVFHEHLHGRAAASLPLVVADVIWAES